MFLNSMSVYPVFLNSMSVYPMCFYESVLNESVQYESESVLVFRKFLGNTDKVQNLTLCLKIQG
jgi:hypothetical protein